MSAGTLAAVDVLGSRERELDWREALAPRPVPTWDLDRFADEQIRGLVRQVFSSSQAPARQAVFTGVDSLTDVQSLCRRVGETLAGTRTGDVAIVGRFSQVVPEARISPREVEYGGVGPPCSSVFPRAWIEIVGCSTPRGMSAIAANPCTPT
jgi:hypothetical protein